MRCFLHFSVWEDSHLAQGHELLHVERNHLRKCYGLEGSISSHSSLFRLRHLQSLDLSFNDFRGSPIPSEFGQFRNMRHLHLFDSNFTGHVPSEIARLSELVSLEISPVGFYEIKIEPAIFKLLAQNLTKLRELDLSYIDMSLVPLASFMNLSSSLTSLILRGCGLRGEIPDEVYQFPQLQELHLRSNNISGKFPRSLIKSGKLTSLDLSVNYFTGQFPDVCNNSSQTCFRLPLTTLYLIVNSFSGTIPSWIFALPCLEELHLDLNLFTGKLEEFQSTSLRQLSLQQNKLHGELPRSIYKQVNLTLLNLSDNNFTGNVELENLSKLKKLSWMHLSHNKISFRSNNSKNYSFDCLTNLRLSSCNISTFPQFLRSFKSLDSLDLSGNGMHGVVPNWFWENIGKNSLQFLDLSNNYLTNIDPLPIFNNFQVLDFRSNLFVGPLPTIVSHSISFFHVSRNNFFGEIPTSFCNITSLNVLVLSYNNLSGKIPLCFEKFAHRLSVLDLQMNKFHGTIPLDFVKGSSIRTLNLNGNELEGPLPLTLLNCEELEVLDVGNNKISGPFPTWLESLPELQVLILRSNRFYGPIIYLNVRLPFQKLRIMDVSNNELTGLLPAKYFENFAAMIDAHTFNLEYMEAEFMLGKYPESARLVIKGHDTEMVKIQKMFITIDFSGNNFTGEIPGSIGKLNSLKGLNFSHNKLSGDIPTHLGNLSNLEFLDLSSNELVGLIPWQLAAHLKELQILNLSRNRLEGPIPLGPQFNTFNNESYLGNIGLCGFPLSRPCTNDTVTPKDESGNEEITDDVIIWDWKVVMMGYGGGVVIGISLGYIVFFSRRFDCWLMKKFGGRLLQGKTSVRMRGRRRISN